VFSSPTFASHTAKLTGRMMPGCDRTDIGASAVNATNTEGKAQVGRMQRSTALGRNNSTPDLPVWASEADCGSWLVLATYRPEYHPAGSFTLTKSRNRRAPYCTCVYKVVLVSAWIRATTANRGSPSSSTAPLSRLDVSLCQTRCIEHGTFYPPSNSMYSSCYIEHGIFYPPSNTMYSSCQPSQQVLAPHIHSGDIRRLVSPTSTVLRLVLSSTVIFGAAIQHSDIDPES
jgi:hypothetical protein